MVVQYVYAARDEVSECMYVRIIYVYLYVWYTYKPIDRINWNL